jgi:hypothetical protein
MSNKFEYTPEMVDRMRAVSEDGLNEAVIESLMAEFDFPRRSVTAKLRKLGYDVPRKPTDGPVFNAEETAAFGEFLTQNSGQLTADEVAAQFMDGKFTNRQVNGKALAMELTSHLRPTEKKVTPRTYTEEEENTIVEMVEAGAFIEDISEALGKTVNSVRGKLLSMSLKAPVRNKKGPTADTYAGIEDMLDRTVEEIAEHFGKTPRGVKTVLTRRGLACADHTPKVAKTSEA